MAGKENIGPALAAASAAWARTLHPRPSADQACAWMAVVFRGGRHLCRAEACPRVCPRNPDHGEPAPPAWPVIPPMTAAERQAQERGLAPLRAALGVVRLEVAVPSMSASAPNLAAPASIFDGMEIPADDADAPPDDISGPQCLMCGDDQSACAWCDKPAAVATTPATPVSVPAMSPPANSRGDKPRTGAAYPPCSGCGAVRTVMLVMAGAFGGDPYTICGRCYRGEPIEPSRASAGARGGGAAAGLG